jgi:hypothetical protein
LGGGKSGGVVEIVGPSYVVRGAWCVFVENIEHRIVGGSAQVLGIVIVDWRLWPKLSGDAFSL